MNPNEEIDEVMKNKTVQQLIDFLKTTFLRRHFEGVKSILVNRQNDFEKQIQELTKENEVLSENLAFEKLKVASLEEKMNKTGVMEKIKNERDALELELDVWQMRFRDLDSRVVKMEVDTQLLASNLSKNSKSRAAAEDHTQPGVGESDHRSLGRARLTVEATSRSPDEVSKKSMAKGKVPRPRGGISEDNGTGKTLTGSTFGKNLSLPNPSCAKNWNVVSIEIDESDDDCGPVRVLSGEKGKPEGCSKSKRLEMLKDIEGASALKRRRSSCISSSNGDTSSLSDSDASN